MTCQSFESLYLHTPKNYYIARHNNNNWQFVKQYFDTTAGFINILM